MALKKEELLKQIKEENPDLQVMDNVELWNKIKNPFNTRLLFPKLEGKSDEDIYKWIGKRDKAFDVKGAIKQSEIEKYSKTGRESYEDIRKKYNIQVDAPDPTGLKEKIRKRIIDVVGFSPFIKDLALGDEIEEVFADPDWAEKDKFKNRISAKNIETIKGILEESKRKTQAKIDSQVYEQLPEKIKNKFWTRDSLSYTSTTDEISRVFSEKLLDGFVGIAPDVAKPILDRHPIAGFLGNVAGWGLSIFLLGEFLATPAVAKMQATWKWMRNAKYGKWLGRQMADGISFGTKGFTSSIMNDISKEDPIELDKAFIKGAEEFGLGMLIGTLPIKVEASKVKGLKGIGINILKRLGIRAPAGAVVGGGWAVINKLVKNRRLKKEDVNDILIYSGIGALTQLMEIGGSEQMKRAVTRSGIKGTVRKQLMKLYSSGAKKLPKSAVKKLADVTENGFFNKNPKKITGTTNPLEVPIIKEFTDKIRFLTKKDKGKFASAWAVLLSKNIDKYDDVTKAWTETSKFMSKQLRKNKLYKDIVIFNKAYTNQFKKEILKNEGIDKAIINTNKVLNDYVKRKEMTITKEQFAVLGKIMKKKTQQMVGKKTVIPRDLVELYNKNKQDLSKITGSFDEMLNQRIKRLEEVKSKFIPFVEKEVRVTASEFLERQKVIKSTFKSMVDKLDIKPELKKKILNYVDGRLDNVAEKFKNELALARELGEEITEKKAKELSGIQLLTKVETKFDDPDFAREFKKISDQYYKRLKDFKNLDPLKKKSMLSKVYLGDWAKGKGVVTDSIAMDEDTFRRVLPFYDPADIKEMRFLANEMKNIRNAEQVAKGLLIGGKLAKERGINVDIAEFQFAPEDYIYTKYGLNTVARALKRAYSELGMEMASKRAVIKNMKMNFRKLAKAEGYNFKQAYEAVRDVLDRGSDYIKSYKKIHGRDIPKFITDMAKQMRPHTEAILKRVNKIRQMSGQRTVASVKDYITHIIKPEIYEQLMVSGTLRSDLAKMLRYIPPKKLFLSTAMHRMDDVLDDLFVKDPFKLLDTMYGMDLRYINTQKELNRIAPIVKFVELSKDYDQTMLNYMKDTMNKLSGRRAPVDETFDRFVEKWVAPWLRKLGVKVNPKRPAKSVVDNINKLAYAGAMGARFKFGVRNVLSQGLHGTWVMEGTPATLWAIRHAFSKKGNRIIKKIPEYLARSPIEGGIEGVGGKMLNPLMIFGKASDKLNVRLAILASFYNGVKKFKGNVRKALEYAGDEFATSQWSYLPQSLPKIMQTSIGKLIFSLNSWTMNYYNRRLPEILRRTFKGVDAWGNRITKEEQRAGARFLVSAITAGTLGLKYGGRLTRKAVNLWRAGNLPMPPQLSPSYQTINNLQLASHWVSAGDMVKAEKYFNKAKRVGSIFIPLNFGIKDFVDVITSKKPIDHIFFYGEPDIEKVPMTEEEKKRKKLSENLDFDRTNTEIQFYKLDRNLAKQQGDMKKVKFYDKEIRKARKRRKR